MLTRISVTVAKDVGSGWSKMLDPKVGRTIDRIKHCQLASDVDQQICLHAWMEVSSNPTSVTAIGVGLAVLPLPRNYWWKCVPAA